MVLSKALGRTLFGALLVLAFPLLASCASGGDADASSSAQGVGEEGGSQTAAPEAAGGQGASDDAAALVSAAEARQLVGEGAYVVDLRNRYAFAKGHIEGARNTGSGRALQVQGDRLPHDRPLLIVAAEDAKGEDAWALLVDMGYEPSSVKVLAGGMEAWVEAGYPVQTSEVKGC